MNTAIYICYQRDTSCPACNQAGAKMVQSEMESCINKAREVYGEDLNILHYIDTDDTLITSRCMNGVRVRRKMEHLLEDIRDGKVDLVAINYMGSLAADPMFVLAFYMYLRKHNVHLLTVREGQKIEEMMERALEEYGKATGIVNQPAESDDGSTVITMIEIDGTCTKIVVTEAMDKFLHLPAGAMEECSRRGLKLYRDSKGEVYLADAENNVVAMNMVAIKSYVTYMLK